MKAIQKKYEKLKKVVDEFRTAEVDLQNQLEDANNQLKNAQSQTQHYSKKLTDLAKQKAAYEIPMKFLSC